MYIYLDLCCQGRKMQGWIIWTVGFFTLVPHFPCRKYFSPSLSSVPDRNNRSTTGTASLSTAGCWCFPSSSPSAVCYFQLARVITLAKFETAALASFHYYELSQRPHNKIWLISKGCSYSNRCCIFFTFHGLKVAATRRFGVKSGSLSTLERVFDFEEVTQWCF